MGKFVGQEAAMRGKSEGFFLWKISAAVQIIQAILNNSSIKIILLFKI